MQAMDGNERLSWRVEGMDCASCVAKVTTAVERLPGVTNVEVNLMAERLTLSLATPGSTSAEVVRQVAALGYTATSLVPSGSSPAVESPHSHGDHEDDPADADKAWWATGKARLVWLLGGLVGLAWSSVIALTYWLLVGIVFDTTQIRRVVRIARAERNR